MHPARARFVSGPPKCRESQPVSRLSAAGAFIGAENMNQRPGSPFVQRSWMCHTAVSAPSGRIQAGRLRLVTNLAEESALFRIFVLAAAMAMGGLGLASQPASAASFGQLPAAALADLDTLAEVQYWEEPRYRYRRSYRDRRTYDYGRPSYSPRRYSAPPVYGPPRNRRLYGASRPRLAPPVRGCYTPPPMGYRTPRVVCSY